MPLVRAMLWSRNLRTLIEFREVARPVCFGIDDFIHILVKQAGLPPPVFAAALTPKDISV